MQITERVRKLLFQHEVLRAKLELKDHVFETVVREIYEQTGQVLSLARIRLAAIEGQLDENLKPQVSDTGKLIGEAILNFRKIGKNLFPEQEILTDAGFIKAISEELQVDSFDNVEILQVSGTPSTPEQDSGVILLAILLNIISSVRRLSTKNSLTVKMQYTEANLFIRIKYLGEPIELGSAEISHEKPFSEGLNKQQRLALIQGSIVRESSDDNMILYQISVPL